MKRKILLAKPTRNFPKFRVKCECGRCGRYIKFLPFKDNLIDLNNKPIEYDDGGSENESIMDYIEDAKIRANEKDIEQSRKV